MCLVQKLHFYLLNKCNNRQFQNSHNLEPKAVPKLAELDDKTRKELREARFKTGMASQMKTVDAQLKLEQDIQRKIERAKKFGTRVKELEYV